MARLLFLGSFAYLLVGFAQLVIGTVMEPMVHDYGVHYGDGGQMVMNQFLGGMTGVLCTPWLIKVLGRKGLLLTALALIAIIQTVYFLQPPWAVMLTVAPITGFGFGITEATVGSIVIVAAGENANKAMSGIEVFFGAGALLMPFIGSLLIATGQWKASFIVVAVIAVAAFLSWLLFWPKILDKSSGTDAETAVHQKTSGSAGRGARLTLAVCILFFAVYVGFEMSFIHYLPSMMVANNGLSDSTASLSISVFWLAMTIGRMVAGHAADRFGGAAYLVAMCGFNAVFFLLMTGLDGVVSTFALTVLAGLAMSGMFSIALVFANRAVPGVTERTTSLLMAAGGIGGALLPKLTGWFLDRFHEDQTRWLFAAFGIVLLLVMLWAVASASKSRRKEIVVSSNM
ncbi:MFS transporter [Cohnella candidum]|uniref:MFS transporter n=1 Tax=Cohnella candidum TaxID=2674991 RepID=A0A3G3K2C3_9BACL|nr:MFS transporter [Cohnella candidum]AYQ74674.1 MFS transporter [Cohnella candidum]